MSEYTLKLDAEAADQIVVSVLKDHKEICNEIITKLKKEKNLKNHQKTDLADYTIISDALEVVLKYFGE